MLPSDRADTHGREAPNLIAYESRLGRRTQHGPLHRPRTAIQFLAGLDQEDRLRSNPQSVVARTIPGELVDVEYYMQVIRDVRVNLPAWRKLSKAQREVKDPYAEHIKNRKCSNGLLLHEATRRRRAQDTAHAKATMHEEKRLACKIKYGSQICAIAATCRQDHISSREAIRRRAREHLGVARVDSVLPDVVRTEIERQRAVVRARAPQRLLVPVEPWLNRWREQKEQRALALIRPALTNSDYYHTSRSKFDALHSINIVFGGEVTADGKTTHGGSKKYGRHGWRRTHVDWETHLTLPVDWWTQIQSLGTHVVEGKLILALDRALPTKTGREAYAADVLIQHAGAKVSVKRVSIIRSGSGPWRIGAIPVRTRYDLILERDVPVNMPARRIP